MKPTSVERSPGCPAIDPDFQGVRVALAPRSHPGEPVLLHGTFRLPWPEADRLSPPRHRALVLVVTSAGGQTALSPFAEQVLFPDDETATPGGALGHLTLDVGALLRRTFTSEAFALVSLGPFTSNVARIPPV